MAIPAACKTISKIEALSVPELHLAGKIVHPDLLDDFQPVVKEDLGLLMIQRNVKALCKFLCGFGKIRRSIRKPRPFFQPPNGL